MAKGILILSRQLAVSKCEFTTFVQGFTGTSLTTLVHTWGLHIKGPVYVALFKPLSIAIAAVFTAIFLGDALHLGRY